MCVGRNGRDNSGVPAAFQTIKTSMLKCAINYKSIYHNWLLPIKQCLLFILINVLSKIIHYLSCFTSVLLKNSSYMRKQCNVCVYEWCNSLCGSMHVKLYVLFPLPIRSTQSNLIKLAGTGLTRSAGVVWVVYLA